MLYGQIEHVFLGMHQVLGLSSGNEGNSLYNATTSQAILHGQNTEFTCKHVMYSSTQAGKAYSGVVYIHVAIARS